MHKKTNIKSMISKLSYLIDLCKNAKRVCTALMVIACVNFSMAQGWEKLFGGNKLDEGYSIIETDDRGYVIVGVSESFGADNDQDLYIFKTDVDGQLMWSRVYDEGFRERGYKVIQTKDRGFVIIGDFQPNNSIDVNLYLVKVDIDGKFLWSRNYGGAGDQVGVDLVEDDNGDLILFGTTKDTDTNNDDYLIIRTNSRGEMIWTKTYGTEFKDRLVAATKINDGYAILGNTKNGTGFDNDIQITRIDQSGAIKWQKGIQTDENEEGKDILGTRNGELVISGLSKNEADALVARYDDTGQRKWTKTFDVAGFTESGEAIIEKPNGEIVIGGQAETSSVNVDFFLLGMDPNGNELWRNITGDVLNTDFAYDLVSTADGGYAFTGSIGKVLTFFTDVALVKTDGEGNTLTSFISGNIFVESCNDFQPNGDIPLEDWVVEAKSNKETFYGTTNAAGEYQIRVDTGEYEVKVFPVNNYWKTCVPGGYIVNVGEFYDTITRPFPITAEINCPYLEIDISTPFLAECSEVIYTVNYCNLGTAPALDAYVDITFDDKLSFVSSSIPFSSQIASKYTFDLGDITVSQCGSFTINTSIACEGIAAGQAALVSAHIFPDTVCTEPDPNWDRSSLIVNGICKGDSIEFLIQNVGKGDMITPRQAIVVEEDVIFIREDVKLKADEIMSIIIPATGKTYRIIAEQSIGHPGRSYPTLAIEGCSEDTNDISTGYALQFPEDDRNPYISIDAKEIFKLDEAVQLRGYPKGYGDEGFISPNTDLKYTIVFSNSSFDTVNHVVIRDTFPEGLDISGITFGASSHPYDYEIYDEGIIKITFDDIILAPLDSSATLRPTSMGYITFSIKQKPGISLGTSIKNSAAVFFENLTPVITNTVTHTIDEYNNFIIDGTISSIPDLGFSSDYNVKIQPNPFSSSALFTIDSDKDLSKVDFRLYDVTGRIIKADQFNGKNYRLSRKGLNGGIYFYSMMIKGNRISSGKILIE